MTASKPSLSSPRQSEWSERTQVTNVAPPLTLSRNSSTRTLLTTRSRPSVSPASTATAAAGEGGGNCTPLALARGRECQRGTTGRPRRTQARRLIGTLSRGRNGTTTTHLAGPGPPPLLRLCTDPTTRQQTRTATKGSLGPRITSYPLPPCTAPATSSPRVQGLPSQTRLSPARSGATPRNLLHHFDRVRLTVPVRRLHTPPTNSATSARTVLPPPPCRPITRCDLTSLRPQSAPADASPDLT